MPSLSEVKESYLREILIRTRGNQARAAEIAGISSRVIGFQIRKFKLEEFVESLRKIN